VRASRENLLNAPPVILQEEDGPVLTWSLEQYLQMRWPTGRNGPA
jgi:hypothetical protein